MEILKEDSPGVIEKCVKILTEGGVLLVPTETVYGLVCDYENMAAREKIYALKQREKSKLLGAFLPDMAAVPPQCKLSRKAILLMEKFMPGALTLVIPDGEGGTFGFRMPDHLFMQKLLQAYGKALAQTSANLSGTPPALSVKEALATLDGEVSLVIDGGSIPPESRSSTVVYVDGEEMKIFREGAIREENIRSAVEK